MESTTQAQPEVYKKLASKRRNIRLLRLLPGKPEDSKIRCQLYRCSLLDAAGHYKALSYVWGSDVPKDEQSVYCNGVRVPVTLNLYSALHSLRNATNVMTIWVDSLCIDQSNERERTRQVRMMREIYSNSQEVVIWLGTGGIETAEVEWEDTRFCGDERDVPKIESHLGKLWKGELVLPHDGQDIYGAFCVISMLAQGLLASKIWYLKNLNYAGPIIRGLLALLDEPWVGLYSIRCFKFDKCTDATSLPVEQDLGSARNGGIYPRCCVL